MKGKQVRSLVLQTIDRLQGSAGSYISAAAIAEQIQLRIEEVQGHLEILEHDGRLNLSKTSSGYSAHLLPRHRQTLREDAETVRHVEMQVTAFNLPVPDMIRTLTGLFTQDSKIHWQLISTPPADQCEGLRVQFPFSGRVEARKSLQIVESRLKENSVDILQRRGRIWRVNLDELRQKVPALLDGIEWATGIAIIEPEIEVLPPDIGRPKESTSVFFSIYKEDFVLERQQKVFLSHKGADKPLVRRFFRVLNTVGFDPWLDEDAMTAGTELERGILQGFKHSCAAVFFITPNFVDEGYLRTEVNYAVAEKRDKGDRFAIITIVFAGRDGKRGIVPALLEQFVWKEPKTELRALNEILRALPIEPGDRRWKT